MNHLYYMNKVFDLARKGVGFVSPNPLVGSILVKDDVIIGAGYHERYGDHHAELNAILSANQDLTGTTLYCNLEPCCHLKKQTPPCAQRIISEKISCVVIANRDPNPLVNGNGIQLLKDAGIEVIEGILEQEGNRLNEIFFTYQRKKRPFIHIKYAQTLDGNIACSNGDSKWITHENARKKAHELRVINDAILIGAQTVLKDNPALTIRLIRSEKKCPWRIILGSLGLIEENLTVVSDEYTDKTILVTDYLDHQRFLTKADSFRKKNIIILVVGLDENGNLNLGDLLGQLVTFKITSILVEGGNQIITSFIKENLFDRISVFIAPKVIGTGLHAVGQLNIEAISKAITFEHPSYELIDDVIYFTGTKLCSPV